MKITTTTIDGVLYMRARAVESEVANLRILVDKARDSKVTYEQLVWGLKAAVERLEGKDG